MMCYNINPLLRQGSKVKKGHFLTYLLPRYKQMTTNTEEVEENKINLFNSIVFLLFFLFFTFCYSIFFQLKEGLIKVKITSKTMYIMSILCYSLIPSVKGKQLLFRKNIVCLHTDNPVVDLTQDDDDLIIESGRVLNTYTYYYIVIYGLS